MSTALPIRSEPAGPPISAVLPRAEGSRAETSALDFIIDLVYERAHIRLHRGKEALIRARLGKRMRALGLHDLAAYCQYLSGPEGEAEIGHTIDALTTNFTHFLREREHFEYAVGAALPALAARGKRFRLWSAACASGEEPYTLAFYLEEHFPLAGGWNWEILATDISSRVLEKAACGIYPEERLQSLLPTWPRKFFQRGYGHYVGFVRVKQAIRERVAFRQMDLLDKLNQEHDFEVIFCRNVMIYFDRPTQQRVADRLSRALVSGGYLFTGRSESLTGLATSLRCVRPSIYQKT